MKTACLVIVFFFASISLTEGQTAKIPRVGYLTGAYFSAIVPRIEAFRQGLRDRGYVEGQNIAVDWRSAEGKMDRLPALAAELLRLNVNVIVTGGPVATRPAHEATKTVPIVMAQDDDPVGNGFVQTLSRPGGNITGLSTLGAELSGKRVELLKEIVPKLSRLAVLGSSTEPANKKSVEEIESAAAVMGIKPLYVDVLRSTDIEPAFQLATEKRLHAILMIVSGPLANSRRSQIAELAVRSRMPVLWTREYVEAGGLISYGVSLPHLDRRAASYVDRILKGANPAELPVEQATDFDLVINLKSARSIGLSIPQKVLLRATKVIK